MKELNDFVLVEDNRKDKKKKLKLLSKNLRNLNLPEDKIKEIHRKEREYPEREKMEMFKEFVRSLDKELYLKAWELVNERRWKEMKKIARRNKKNEN